MIIRNREVFSPNFVPSELPHRREEVDLFISLASAGNNVLVFGPTASGKTTVAKYAARSSKFKTIYVDSKYNQVPYTVVQEICRQLYGIEFKGYSYREVFERVRCHPAQKVVVFDDFPLLFLRKYSSETSVDSYSMLESLVDGGINVVLATYRADAYDRLPSSLLSRLNCKRIVLKSYSEREMYDILIGRASEGLYPGTWKEEYVADIASYVAKKNGNIRSAIAMLYDCAKRAENSLSESIRREDVDAVLSEEPSEVYWLEVAMSLPVHQIAVVAAVAELMETNGPGADITSGKVYSKYMEWCRRFHVTPTKYSVYASELIPYVQTMGIVLGEKTSLGRGRGITRILSLTGYLNPSSVVRRVQETLVEGII
jgi:cell division control protein 6